jgi:hypothetical protein
VCVFANLASRVGESWQDLAHESDTTRSLLTHKYGIRNLREQYLVPTSHKSHNTDVCTVAENIHNPRVGTLKLLPLRPTIAPWAHKIRKKMRLWSLSDEVVGPV